MAAILRDSVVVVVRTRPQAIPLAMITMRKSVHEFPFLSYMSMTPRGSRRSSAKKQNRLKTYCINPDNTNKNACVLQIGFYCKKKTQHLCVIQYAMYHSA